MFAWVKKKHTKLVWMNEWKWKSSSGPPDSRLEYRVSSEEVVDGMNSRRRIEKLLIFIWSGIASSFSNISLSLSHAVINRHFNSIHA